MNGKSTEYNQAIAVMKNTSVRHALESTSCDYQNEQEGSQKKSQGLLQSKGQNNGQEKKNNLCLDTSISLVALEDSPWQQNNVGTIYRQLSLLKSTPMLKESLDLTSQGYQFTQISETTNQNQDNSISLQWDSPALAQVTQEVEQDLNIQLPLFGEKVSDVLWSLNPNSVLLNNLKELSDEDFELFLGDSTWQDTLGRLKQSRRESLGRVIKDSDCLSFPTLTSNVSTTSRPAGQSKCEKWFKDNGLIAPGYQLSSQAIAMIMGFPPNWFDSLSPTEPQEESKADILQDEPLPQDKQRSLSDESSTSQKLLGGEDNSPLSTENSSSLSQKISIPCIVKQPKQPEVRGVIRKDEGDRFVVDVDGETIFVSKLFVYPDFSKTVGQINKNPRKNITPSKESPRKTRRKKGEGNGTIYYRTVTKNGKQYQEAYYHYIENGKKRTKYIRGKLLDRVKEAESLKLPVSDIFILLGGDKKNPRKSSSTFVDKYSDNSESNLEISPSKVTPPSKKRNEAVLGVSPMSHRFKKRKKGYGTGYIECKPIKTSAGKEYQQYWYHWEEWEGGDRLLKKSKYIPKRLVARVEKMETEKIPVENILEVLSNKKKK